MSSKNVILNLHTSVQGRGTRCNVSDSLPTRLSVCCSKGTEVTDRYVRYQTVCLACLDAICLRSPLNQPEGEEAHLSRVPEFRNLEAKCRCFFWQEYISILIQDSISLRRMLTCWKILKSMCTKVHTQCHWTVSPAQAIVSYAPKCNFLGWFFLMLWPSF